MQGGPQTSQNTVTVTSPNVTYSDNGSCLKVKLKLLNGTGEKVGNKIIVEDGDDWTGQPDLQPGGNCPCPSPSPSIPPISDIQQLPDEDRVGYVGVFTADGQPDRHYRVNLGLDPTTIIRNIEVDANPYGTASTSNSSYAPIVIYQNGVQRNTTYLSTFGPVGTPTTWDIYLHTTYNYTLTTLRITLADGTVLQKPFNSVVQ